MVPTDKNPQPWGHRSIDYWFAGGAPQVQLYAMELGLIHPERQVCAGILGDVLTDFENSHERTFFRGTLGAASINGNHIDPDRVIVPPGKVAKGFITRTYAFFGGTFVEEANSDDQVSDSNVEESAADTAATDDEIQIVTSNLCDSAICKTSGISPKLIVDDKYIHEGQARVFFSQDSIANAMKESGNIQENSVLLLMLQGIEACGYPEVATIATAAKLDPVIATCLTVADGRVSGGSGSNTISEVQPEALTEDSPLSKVRDGGLGFVRKSTSKPD